MGIGLLADAWMPEDAMPFRERRRRQREERSLNGEAMIGLGILCMAAALIGRDSWRYGTIAVIAGTLLFVLGAWKNKRYLGDRITNRGALRRAETTEGSASDQPHERKKPPAENADRSRRLR
ncbi:MAG: hypothetical protein H0T54_06695 [Geodermatophilaceae bacterium]|nr:hypothetical protein [Geodermatophilaceae bacterium]